MVRIEPKFHARRTTWTRRREGTRARPGARQLVTDAVEPRAIRAVERRHRGARVAHGGRCRLDGSGTRTAAVCELGNSRGDARSSGGRCAALGDAEQAAATAPGRAATMMRRREDNGGAPRRRSRGAEAHTLTPALPEPQRRQGGGPRRISTCRSAPSSCSSCTPRKTPTRRAPSPSRADTSTPRRQRLVHFRARGTRCTSRARRRPQSCCSCTISPKRWRARCLCAPLAASSAERVVGRAAAFGDGCDFGGGDVGSPRGDGFGALAGRPRGRRTCRPRCSMAGGHRAAVYHADVPLAAPQLHNSAAAAHGSGGGGGGEGDGAPGDGGSTRRSGSS